MSIADENRNYHSTGKSVFDGLGKDTKFQEYRRQWRENPLQDILSPAPLHLDIESTNICNLRCKHCAATYDKWGSNKRGFMDFKLFKSTINEAVEIGVYCVKYSLRGEALLHPKIIDMINYTTEAGLLDHYLNTNGMLMNENMCRRLIESGLPRISISIDGWDEKSFNENRPGADYKIVCENIATLMRLRKELSSVTPRVRVQAVMLSGMENHWEEYKSFWIDKVDEVGYLDARCEDKMVDHRGKIDADFCCPFLWQRMSVLWDGTLLPCLLHGVSDIAEMTHGNVKNIGIKSSWKSEKTTILRKLHRNGKTHEIPACDECSYRATEIMKHADSCECKGNGGNLL